MGLAMNAMRLAIGFAAVVAIAAPLSAHHGAASFDSGKELTLKGTVHRMDLVEPALISEVRRQG